ncbi:ROK family protein [uncultured Hyphomonas sp.]|uniref:ROK family protein n=1 Tax=uncultured Hyphomonas sp. TaxID=225298 RepID=UPI002AAA8247|nr:ROK family protein [uncultured Hyphomonas sp.]
MLGGIEAGGTKIVCAVGSSPDHILASHVVSTADPATSFQQVRAFFDKAQGAHGRLGAIGVAGFGPVDIDPGSPTYGTVQRTPKPGWKGANWVDGLSRLGCPVMVDTDVNGAALGEWRHGAGKGHATLAYVTVGTGIGAGILKDGRSLSGIGHYEMGHIYPPHDYESDPFPGRCPFHKDCLEGLASGPAIMDRWGVTLSEMPPGHPAFALQAGYLAHLAATIILTHMPDRIIFGGSVMKAPGLMERLRAATRILLADYLPCGPAGGDLMHYLVPPALGDQSGVTGALAMAEARTGQAVK